MCLSIYPMNMYGKCPNYIFNLYLYHMPLKQLHFY